jgi:HEPN domain-containing protein
LSYNCVVESRARDWFAQAENDAAWAQVSLDAGFYSQVCYISQQIGEKALKALALSRGFDEVKSHSIRKIAEELDLNGDVAEAARVLDIYYISARYPEGLPEGSPFESFGESQAVEALNWANLILEKVRVAMNVSTD